jgi:hypothetical protein
MTSTLLQEAKRLTMGAPKPASDDKYCRAHWKMVRDASRLSLPAATAAAWQAEAIRAATISQRNAALQAARRWATRSPGIFVP